VPVPVTFAAYKDKVFRVSVFTFAFQTHSVTQMMNDFSTLAAILADYVS
jgi:hypothetical protein